MSGPDPLPRRCEHDTCITVTRPPPCLVNHRASYGGPYETGLPRMRSGMMNRLKLSLAVAAIPACAVLQAGSAKAVLVYELIQQGSDVQVKLSGSLSGLPSPNPGSFSEGLSAVFEPSLGRINLSNGFSGGVAYSVSGPSGFGPTFQISNITSLSASIATSFLANSSRFGLASGYTQGTPITSTGLILGKSLSTLGLSSTSGLLGTWTIGSDSIEVWAGAKPTASSAAAPGPLPLLGAGAAFGYSRRLRSRLRGGRPSLKA